MNVGRAMRIATVTSCLTVFGTLRWYSMTDRIAPPKEAGPAAVAAGHVAALPVRLPPHAATPTHEGRPTRAPRPTPRLQPTRASLCLTIKTQRQTSSTRRRRWTFAFHSGEWRLTDDTPHADPTLERASTAAYSACV